MPEDSAGFLDLETPEDFPPEDFALGLTIYGFDVVADRLVLDSRFLRAYFPLASGNPPVEDVPDACISPAPPTGIAWEAPVPAPAPREEPLEIPECGA